MTPEGRPGPQFLDPPAFAAWRHRESRDGFEVVFLQAEDGRYRVEGQTAAMETGEAWLVEYAITLDSDWVTRNARVQSRTATGRSAVAIGADGAGNWRVNGKPAPHLDGCLDLDLESSALTNAFPVHRLALVVGEEADAPAAYVRALDLSIERLEQHYSRIEDDGERQRYHYTAPAFEFETDVAYDRSGLVLTYPGIAIRVA